MRFSETIFNAELLVNGCEIITGLHFGIISLEECRTAFFPKKIFICYWTVTFRFHGVDIYHATLDTVENLAHASPPKALQLAKKVSVSTGSISLWTFRWGKCGFQCLWRGTQVCHFTNYVVHSSVLLIVSKGRKARHGWID